MEQQYYQKPISLFTKKGKRIIWIAGDNTYLDNSVSFMSYDAKINLKSLNIIRLGDAHYINSRLKTINFYLQKGIIIEHKVLINSLMKPFLPAA